MIEFLLLPFVAGLLVLATHVPLGRRVLDRGIVFVDLAVAQVAGLGALTAHWLGWDGTIGMQALALAAALAAAGLLTLTERWFDTLQEAVIGVLFVGAASLELVLLAFDSHGADHLRDLLVGQVLWVTPAQLWPLAVLAVALPLAMRSSARSVFYGAFAVCITASVQVAGLYLVFASLIAPALGARAFAARHSLTAGYAIGATGYAAGLAASALTDAPTGPAIVLGLIVSAMAAAIAIRTRPKPR